MIILELYRAIIYIGIRITLICVIELSLWLVGRQWRFEIFAVGLQIKIKLNQDVM